jgi:hypothetical protein
MLTPSRTAKEYEEMLDFAERTQQVKQALNPLAPLKALGNAVSRGVQKIPFIGKPAVASTPYQFGYGVPGAEVASAAGQAATGLFKWAPAAGRLATAPMRWAANNPLTTVIGGGALAQINSTADDLRNRIGSFADGVSHGAAGTLHGFANAPFAQRLSGALFPQAAMNSESMGEAIKAHTAKQMQQQSAPVRMMLGDTMAPSIMDKLRLMQAGQSPDLSPRVRELLPLAGEARLRGMQDLWKKIEDYTTQGTNATTAGT